MIVNNLNNNKIKLYSYGKETNYFGTSIEYDDKTNTFLFFYYPSYLKIFIVNGLIQKDFVPQVEKKCNIIATFENSNAFKLKKFISEKNSSDFFYFPPTFFYEILSFFNKKDYKIHLNNLFFKHKRYLVNGISYSNN